MMIHFLQVLATVLVLVMMLVTMLVTMLVLMLVLMLVTKDKTLRTWPKTHRSEWYT